MTCKTRFQIFTSAAGPSESSCQDALKFLRERGELPGYFTNVTIEHGGQQCYPRLSRCEFKDLLEKSLRGRVQYPAMGPDYFKWRRAPW